VGLVPCFDYPQQTTDNYRLALSSAKPRALYVPYQAESWNSQQFRRHSLENNRITLLAPTETLSVRSEGTSVYLNTDLIAPLIWLLELKEEQTIPWRDRYGLFDGCRSVRHRLGMLSDPIFENTALWLAQLLGFECSHAYPNKASWAVAVSCDIDVLDDDHLINVLNFFERHGVEYPTFMICTASLGEKTIRDPTYDFSREAVRKHLLALIDAQAEIGLHGSYLAHDRLDLLLAQKRRLEEWWGQGILGHRAHYYRFAYPRSWAWQMRAGFSYDASLGYPDLPGFRSGTASPVMFYDPENGPVPFAIFPTGLLDQHFFWPREWSLDEFERYSDRLLESIARTHGVLTLDWHTYTHSLPTYDGWWDRLDRILGKARSAGAYIAGIGKIFESYRSRWNRYAPIPSPNQMTPKLRFSTLIGRAISRWVRG
jgi:hypothetical protein